ncbi:hypothetical protein ACQPTN_07690 [Bradyrhizobium sp. 13971]
MTGSNRLRLFPYYLNSRRLGLLADIDFGTEAQKSLANNSSERVQAMRDVAHTADDLLQSGAIPSLTELVAQKDRKDGERVLGFVWAVFTFSGAAAAKG